jgi:thiazole synthase
MVSGTPAADVLVIGDGLIGLSTALELGRAGVRTVVVGSQRAGAATVASAGLLIPSAGHLARDVQPFFLDSLARYPAFVQSLREFDAELAIIEGVVERGADGDRLLEPDGAIDPARLLGAVRRAVEAHSSIEMIEAVVTSLDLTRATPSATIDKQVIHTRKLVVAAGAWTPLIAGLPRPLPIRPLKGQMVALGACPLNRAMMGDDVYLVPRDGTTIVGATVEEVGFDLSTTAEATQWLVRSASELCPELTRAELLRTWAGTRPATPDMLPILGADPAHSNLIYACGHSKNGILLAPGTASHLARLCVTGETDPMLVPFQVARFS